MEMLDERSVLQAAEGVLSAEHPGEVIVLDERHGVFVGLSDVGLRVWELIQRPRSVGQIVDALAAEYDVERARCLRDVLELAADLIERGVARLGSKGTDLFSRRK